MERLGTWSRRRTIAVSVGFIVTAGLLALVQAPRSTSLGQTAAPPTPASAYASALAALDTSACPNTGGSEGQDDPFALPRVDDPDAGEGAASAQAPSGPAPAVANGPNIDLDPTLRPATPAGKGAPAAKAATTPNVELDLRWCAVQPRDPATVPAGEPKYDWAAYDEILNLYVKPPPDGYGVPVYALRVADAPKWAITQTCWEDGRAGRVKLCPPKKTQANTVEPKLKAFASALAAHYGPASAFNVSRLEFWNEPNIDQHWGVTEVGDWSFDAQQDAAQRYTVLLARFYNGAKAEASQPMYGVDAGEVSAPGTNTAEKRWARYFTDYAQQAYPGKYDVLTIHPYSEWSWQILAKVDSYHDLAGMPPVAVTEFAYGDGQGDVSQCADAVPKQPTRFLNTIKDIRAHPTTIRRVVWFSVIDNHKEDAKCTDQDWYNQVHPGTGKAAHEVTNTYGLYRRDHNGQLPADPTSFPRGTLSKFQVCQGNADECQP